MNKNLLKFFVLLMFAVMISSCYNVRLLSTKGTPQPKADPSEEGNDKYRTVEMIEIDTVYKVGQGNQKMQNRKITFGGVQEYLWRLITEYGYVWNSPQSKGEICVYERNP